MFKKILVAEDFESASISVQRALKDLEIADASYINYCDEALESFKKSLEENTHFDLLITDLSFEPDHKYQKLKSGVDLISEVRKLEPDLKILVFSTEKKPQKIKSLFEDFGINGFVSKGRMDVKELKKAITEIYDHQKYLSHDTIINLRKTDALELTALEFSLLKALSEGVLQKYIPDYLKERDLKPNSLSSIEKILNQLKESLKAKSNEHLIAICKDLGVL